MLQAFPNAPPIGSAGAGVDGQAAAFSSELDAYAYAGAAAFVAVTVLGRLQGQNKTAKKQQQAHEPAVNLDCFFIWH